jgi:hypothetical protein
MASLSSRLTERDQEFMARLGIKCDSPERYQLRAIALEAQNKVLWEHIHGLTVTSAYHEDRAEKWRGRWAKVFGLAMIEGLVIAGLVLWMFKG